MKIHLTETLIQSFMSEHRTQRFTVSDKMVTGLSLELRPSGDGSWRYRYTYDRKQECFSLGLLSKIDLETARKLAYQASQKVAQGENPARASQYQSNGVCPKFKDFINDYYLPHIRSYKRCVSADMTLLNNHLLPEFGELRMYAISRERVLAFQKEKIEAGYKPAYCNRFLILLGFCFNLAMKWEIAGVSKNPAKLISLLKANNKIERFLTKEESARLLAAINQSPNPMLRYFVQLALLTGMRKREILDAKWEDVDLNRKLWLIPHSKSGYKRQVPLTEASLSVLKELKEQLPNLMAQKLLLDNPWVIPNWRTGKPFKSIFNAWDSARKKAGLEDLRIHDLRHSFASALVNQGIPIYDVQKLLGHQDVKTTERYAHFSIERLRSSASAMSNFYDFELEDA